METAIEINEISKVYKLYEKPGDRLKEALAFSKKKLYTEHYALDHVSFDIRKGETVGIIGTNGAGKSTLLKIITGVLTPTSGSARVNGRISALLELGAGFNMEYSGIENIYLNGTMCGFSREEVDARMEDILRFADIGDFVHQPVKTYSSGMFVRLAFAVAINIDPEILIVDEALSVGDVFFQAKCYKKFEEFKKNGKTILLVSHSLGTVAKYCDKVVLLNKGTKVGEGSAPEMIDLYKKILVNPELTREELEEDGESGEIIEETLTTDNWKEKLTLNPHINSYGNGDAEIIDFAVIDKKRRITNSLNKGDRFSIKVKVKFFQKIQEPIIAFTILNLQGTEVTGTNTMLENAEIEDAEEDDVKTVTFTQSLDIQGGEYLLSLGCTGYREGEFTVYHRLYEVCNITVISEKNTVGFYDMNSVIEIEQ